MDLFTTFCNLCYKEEVDLKDMHSDVGNISVLRKVIQRFVPQIDFEGSVPLYLCADCCNRILEMDRFKQMCTENMVELKNKCLRKKEELEIADVKVEDISSVLKSIIERFKDYTAKQFHDEITLETLYNNDRNYLGLNHIVDNIANNIEIKQEKTDLEFENESVRWSVGQLAITPGAPSLNEGNEIVNGFMAEVPSYEEDNEDGIKVENVDYSLNVQKVEKDMHMSFEEDDTNVTVISNQEIKEEPSTDEYEPEEEASNDHYTEPSTLKTKKTRSNVALSSSADSQQSVKAADADHRNKQQCISTDETKDLVNLSTTNSSNESYKRSCNQTRDKTYTCNLCDKSFARSYSLTVHKRTHTGEKRNTCDWCKKSFVHLASLINHKRIHTGEKPYKCAVCGKAFSYRGCLSDHVRIHTGDRPHKCEVCNKHFIRRQQLIIHQRIHTGEKYKCIVCGETFPYLSILLQHKRTHNGDGAYACDVCNKSFLRRHHLTSHQRIHTGEKPYSCAICCKAFTQQGDLNRHSRKHSVDNHTNEDMHAENTEAKH